MSSGISYGHLLFLVAAQFLELTGPDQQRVEINVSEIVSIRAPRRSDHFAAGINCVIFTSDGKYVGVMESCPKINDSIENEQKPWWERQGK